MEFANFGEYTPSSDLWTRLNRNYARLEETKYYPQNVYQREKDYSSWPGDTEGRTLLAWIMLARASGRAPRYLRGMLALWPSEVNELGYFGQIYTDGISEQQLASHGWVLQALAELERASQAGEPWAQGIDAKALAMPIIENLFLPTKGKYREYSIDPTQREEAGSFAGSHQAKIGAWLLSTDIGCFTIGMTGVIDAAEAFDLKDQLSELIVEMIERFKAIDLQAIQAQTHATLTALRGMIRWSKMTNDHSLWSDIEDRYSLYTDCAWTETYANYNWFGRTVWTEPCAVVDSLIVVMELWAQTQTPEYLEHAQHIWFNALGHGQRANGGFGCDNCPGADGEVKLKFSAVEAHWCCTMRGSEGIGRLCQYQVAQDGPVYHLPFGLAGTYAANGCIFDIETDYPNDAKWIIRNQGEQAVRLMLFVPSWVQGVATEDAYGLMFTLKPNEVKTIEGVLQEGERELLPSTQAAMPEIGQLHVKFRGPLILAQYGENMQPIHQDYLRNNMDITRSSKTILFHAD